MPKLVLLALEGPDFVAAMQQVWANGDAIAPLDMRLPVAQQRQIIAALAPDTVIEADREQRSLSASNLTRGIDALPVRPLEQGDALVLTTSGSTGDPKGVIHTHASIAASAKATSSALEVQRDDTWLACLPLSHIGGLSVVIRALLTNTSLVVHKGFDASAVTQAATNGASLVSLVTRAMRQIDTSLFRRILLGGGPVPPDKPSNAVATYGMTETGSGLVYDGWPIDGARIKIVDGEVWVKGPMLMRCYRSAASSSSSGTQAVQHDNGWLATGDGGTLSADDKLTIFGRRGEVIRTGGENVWPAMVEKVLLARPDVAAVRIVGEPDPQWGSIVVAHVTPAPGIDPATLSLDSLKESVKAMLPPWAAPKKVRLW